MSKDWNQCPAAKFECRVLVGILGCTGDLGCIDELVDKRKFIAQQKYLR